jgi:uncharacterized protein YgiM (DUF1202 family)
VALPAEEHADMRQLLALNVSLVSSNTNILNNVVNNANNHNTPNVNKQQSQQQQQNVAIHRKNSMMSLILTPQISSIVVNESSNPVSVLHVNNKKKRYCKHNEFSLPRKIFLIARI